MLVKQKPPLFCTITHHYCFLQAAAEEFAVAYENTYKMPIVVVHTMNVFGERSLPSKFIPKVIII